MIMFENSSGLVIGLGRWAQIVDEAFLKKSHPLTLYGGTSGDEVQHV